jgi:hypothetical protein
MPTGPPAHHPSALHRNDLGIAALVIDGLLIGVDLGPKLLALGARLLLG